MPFHEVSPTIRITYTIHHPSTSQADSKPWVILIHGLADPQTSWAYQTPAFTAAGYTVLTYDNRGVGESTRPSKPEEVYTSEDMASDLHSLITALNVPRPYHLMGVSMGGMIAQTYALRYALSDHNDISENELLSLTLASTYAAPGPFCTRMFKLWRDMAQKMSVAAVMRDVSLWAFTPSFFSDEKRQDERAEFEREMSRIDEDMGLPSYLAQLNVITIFDSRDQVGRLRELRDRVIVLTGEEDILIPTSLSKELCDLIEGSLWKTTKGGHACTWEFANEFNRACLDGWKDIEDRRA